MRPRRFYTALVLGALAVLASARPSRAQVPTPTPEPGGPSSGQSAAGGLAIPPSRGVDVIQSYETPPRATESPAQDRLRLQEAARFTEQPRPTPSPEPTPPPTDFQQFAAASVGTLLPLFGRDLFTRPPSTFAPVEDLPASPDYVVATGDELHIRGWGQVNIDVRAIVSREGTISIPRVGVVSVSGVRFQDLTGRIKAAVARYYRNFDLSVSLGRLRSVQVFVVGRAQRPGLYTVSSLSTMMNALFASGGPSPTGSMRSIQLRRGDQLVGEFDLYDLLLKGDKSKDQRLQSGDVILIPPTGPVAAIAGRVKTPAIYELKENATTLSELLGYAGGPTTTAAEQSVLLERLDRKLGRLEEDLPWNDDSLATKLRDGDVVMLRTVSQRFGNAVTLRGHVASPMRTAWRKGMRISDLIPDRTALIPESYWRRSASRAYERTDDRARGLSRSVSQSAATQKESFERLKTDVENLMEEVNWDYAVVERLDPSTLEPRLLPFNLRRAVVDRDPAQDLEIQPGDVVTVFSKKDILPPSRTRTYFVRLEGELAAPGIYQVGPGETLRQLLAKVGGLSPDAYLYGAEFNRESVRLDQQRRLEELADRADRELQRSGTERLARATSTEDIAATRAQLEAQRLAITRMRSLRASGRMVLELKPSASTERDLPDLKLEDGDRFFVPARYSTVGVYGSVYNQSTFLYRPGRKVDDYLRQAGGPTREADDKSTYVLRADGSVVSRRQSGVFSNFGGQELMPNDTVVVPEDFAPVSWVKELKDWSQIFFQFGLGVAALKVLVP